MKTVTESLVAYLVASQISHQVSEDASQVLLWAETKECKYECRASAENDRQLLVFHCICPFKASEEKRAPLNEILARLNADVAIGNFELDMDSGEVRFKTSIALNGSELTPALAEPIVMGCVFTMNAFLQSIGTIVFSDVTSDEQANGIGADKNANEGTSPRWRWN